MENYTKFVFRSGPSNAPKRAPSQTPGVNTRLSATQKKSADRLKAKKGVAQKLKGDKEKVWKAWLDNNPKGTEKMHEDDPKYLALKHISDARDKERAFILLGIIQKSFGGKKVALDLYKNAWKNGKFDIDVIRAHFSKDKCKDSQSSVGFYYGTRTFKVVFTSMWGANKTNPVKYKLTGWWAWDSGEDNVNSITVPGRKNTFKKWASKNLGGKGYGDEFVGKDILDALSNNKKGLHKELQKKVNIMKLKPDERDSNLDPQREEDVITELDRLKKIPVGVYPSKSRREILIWFKKNQNKWTSLDKSIAGTMTYLFGAGSGLFKYRYVPAKKKIYFMRIDNAPLKPGWAKFGYINVKDGKLDGKWNGLKEAAFKTMISKEVLDDLSVSAVKTEIQKHEAETAKAPSKEALLAATKGRLKSIVKRKSMKYSALNSDYYSKIEKKLKEKLVKEGKTDANATRFAAARIEQFKKDIAAYFDGNIAFKEKLDANPDKVITIEIDSKDKVNITSRDKKINKLKGALGAAGGTINNMKGSVDEMYKKVMNSTIGSLLGSFGSMVGIDVKKDVAEYLKTGKKSIILTILAFFSGGALSRRMLGARSITNLSQLQQLAKKNRGVLRSKLRIKTGQELKGLRVEIPKGKGIIPGGKFRVKVEGLMGMQEVSPAKAKAAAKAKGKGKKKSGFMGVAGGLMEKISGIFGGMRKSNETGPLFENAKITIKENTKIPPGTYIPKGAKIVTV